MEMESERGKKNEREQYKCMEEAPASYYRSSIDRSLSILGAYPSESLFGGMFSTVKNPPCRGGTVRCFFLDGKCRRHKCLFDLMTRCPTRTRTGTYTLTYASTFYLPWGPSEFPLATRPHVALLSPLKKQRARKSRARSSSWLSTREIIRRQ